MGRNERANVMGTANFPRARAEDVTDSLGGMSFPDPFRWLEQDSEEVGGWQREQATRTSAHVRAWQHFEALHRLVADFSTERLVPLPRKAGAYWFRTHFAGVASQAQAIVADEPAGDGRVLFDPLVHDPGKPPFLSWIAPSPDGRTLAIGVCEDGSENNKIVLLDASTGRPLPDPPANMLMDNWTGGVHWLADSSGFFFAAIDGSPTDFDQQVYLHRRTSPPTTERLGIPWTEAREYRMVVVSRDGRHAVAVERLRNPVPVAIADLGTGPLQWRPFVTSIAGTLAGHVLGGRYVAVTDVGAPRGRLVAIPLDAGDPNDPAGWEELVPQSPATLQTVTPVGDLLYLSEFVDTYARVRVVDSAGKALGEVPLPGKGALMELPFPIMNIVPRGCPDSFLFGFSSLVESLGLYRHLPGAADVQVLRAPEVRLHNVAVDDRWAEAPDGTRVPYHVVRRIDVAVEGPRPTLVYAYGGFNVPLSPGFPGPMAAFVAAGGTFVHAHLRGGAEYGLEWWEGGRLRNKQNSYRDLYAVAEDLVAAKLATPDTLALTGGSNGGLMSGVALTQRPDLWKVVVPRAPILDLVGACREPYGRMLVTMEYADIDDPAEVRRLATFSPYHLVREGVCYPAVYIDAGDTDPRCPAWHARKFAARLQHVNATGEPVFLNVWENVGHGWATDKKVAINQHAEWLAFILSQLGCEPSWGANTH